MPTTFQNVHGTRFSVLELVQSMLDSLSPTMSDLAIERDVYVAHLHLQCINPRRRQIDLYRLTPTLVPV